MNTALPLNYFSSLQQLKFDAANHAKLDSNATVEAMATQFESLFVNEMLKSMRATINENELFGSDAIKQYTEMYDQQLSLHIAQKGLGLKDVIIAQLGGKDDNNESISVWDNKESFIQDIKQTLEESLPGGIDHNAIISIAALETGWGKKVMTRDYDKSSHNIFSIKADRSWQGDKTLTKTTEFINGQRIESHEAFRAYDNLNQAVMDFAKFMQKPRYEKAMSVASNGKEFIHEIASAGYATDPKYEEKLLRIYNDL